MTGVDSRVQRMLHAAEFCLWWEPEPGRYVKAGHSPVENVATAISSDCAPVSRVPP